MGTAMGIGEEHNFKITDIIAMKQRGMIESQIALELDVPIKLVEDVIRFYLE